MTLEIARQLGRAATDAWQDIQHHPRRHDMVARGADGTPTSRADKMLDDAMLAVAADLGIDVLSEETGRVGNHGGKLAVIDPLDGSRNAGRGIPFYATSIAIGTQSLTDVEASVVINLATGDRYEADASGSFYNGVKITAVPHDPNEIMVAVIGDEPDIEVVKNLHKRGLHMRDLGAAALELCLVGTGALDAFHVPQPWLRVIDIAAGVHFTRQAGGLVLDPVIGGDLDMPFDLLPRRGVLAVSHPSMLEAIA